MLLHLGPERDRDLGIFSILAFGSCHATSGALDGVVHPASRIIFGAVDGISAAVHDVVAALVVLVLLGGHRFSWNIAQLLDEAVRDVVFGVGVEHVALVALVKNHHVPAAGCDVLE